MSPSTTPHVLLLGGHGRVALLLTPRLLARGWQVTSVIRDAAQRDDVLAAGAGTGPSPGRLDVRVASLEEVRDEAAAGALLEGVGAGWVVWAAGAGGKGGPARTHAIDSVAARCFIRASVARPSISKFLMVSALSIRRRRAPWWSEEEWRQAQKVNSDVMPAYYQAKLEADDCLTVLGKRRKGFQYVVLRPGSLKEGPATEKVQLGRTQGMGGVSRADVAEVAARLLEVNCKGWFDLLSGEEEVGSAVKRVLDEGVDSVEGEDVQEMEGNLEI